MDALRNIVGNIPHWNKRLDELSNQIEQRQIELAKFAEAHPPPPADFAAPGPTTWSLRNKGSTESLRPKDEPAAHPVEVATPSPIPEAVPETTTTATPPVTSAAESAPVPAGSSEPAAIPSKTVAGPAATPSPGAAAASETAAAEAASAQSLPPAPTPAAAAAAAVAVPPKPRPISSADGDPSSPHRTPSLIQRQTDQVIAAAQAKARATVRKRNRSDSIVSAEGVVPKYRSRTMVLVYYDSYVQSLFEELVKFISASRNLMRKAKVAAKVAQIKRMAELEMPDGDDGDDGAELKPDDEKTPMAARVEPRRTLTADAAIEPSPPAPEGQEGAQPEPEPLSYVTTRYMRSYGRYGPGGLRPNYGRAAAGGATGLAALMGGGGPRQQPDAFDALDKALEQAQSMCERAAHQFLRDGDCDDEIASIKKRLAETNYLANKETERILKEDPTAANPEPLKSRSYRIQSMRRDPSSPSSKDASAAAAVVPAAAVAPSPPPAPSPAPMDSADGRIEADEDKIEVDEGIGDVDYESMPKFVYKSTRMMGRAVR